MKLWIGMGAALLLQVGGSTLSCDMHELRGTGSVEREERSISGVRAVAVENQGDLFIEIGDEERLVIEAQPNILERLEADMGAGTLHLRTAKGHWNLRPTKPIRYFLTVPALEELRVSSAGSIEAPALKADHFEISISSSGDIRVEELIADTLEVRISSSGSLTIESGRVEEQELTLSSSGDYDAEGLESAEADARLSSSGSARIRVTDLLDARLTSSGGLRVHGDPEVHKKESSSGRVRVR
jgi:hypothetical protein